MMNTEETQIKKNKEKNFKLKPQYCFFDFSEKHNIQNSCDL